MAKGEMKINIGHNFICKFIMSRVPYIKRRKAGIRFSFCRSRIDRLFLSSLQIHRILFSACLFNMYYLSGMSNNFLEFFFRWRNRQVVHEFTRFQFDTCVAYRGGENNKPFSTVRIHLSIWPYCMLWCSIVAAVVSIRIYWAVYIEL